MNSELNKSIEEAIVKLNKKPTRTNLNKLLKLLKEFSDEYEKQFGYVPVMHIDQFLVCLSLEVVKLYRDELPFSQ